jgi:ABC-type polysaccharide/polyol phosphate transport system ATPase subunit
MLKGTLLGEAATTNGYRALQGITFEIQRGDKIGLIGNNGAGKSSLLRIIAGLSLPSDGELQVRGQVTLLAALGMGMVDELSLG